MCLFVWNTLGQVTISQGGGEKRKSPPPPNAAHWSPTFFTEKKDIRNIIFIGHIRNRPYAKFLIKAHHIFKRELGTQY